MGMLNFLGGLISPQAIAHDVTFDLTTPHPCHKTVLQRTGPSIHVPIEIVIDILEAAYDEDDHEGNMGLFASCSLVCKDWSFVAQKLLFRHVTLRSQPAYVSFQQAVDRSTPRGRMLGDTAVRMRVVLDHNQPYRISERSFARAVAYCPNLRELDLALYGQGSQGHDVSGSPHVSRTQHPAPTFDDRTLALLRSGPRISSLQFSNWSDNSSPLPQLLDVWPSLTALSISGTPPKLPSGFAARFPCAVEELRMNFQKSPAVDFMKWLLHNSAASLRAIRLDRMPSPELLEHLIAEHGATLQTLALPVCSAQENAALLQCASLRALNVESAWTPKVLPDTLEHLAIGVDIDTPLQAVVRAIKRSEVMKTVTVHIWHGGERHPLLANVRIACAVRGIELRLTHDIRVFRTITAHE